MMYSLNMRTSVFAMMVMMVMMFDGSSAYTLVGSDEVFMRASNPTSATWYHKQALRFQNVIEDEFDSYHENFGELM